METSRKKSEEKLEDIFSFLKLLHQFRAVERRIYTSKERVRRENDVEHSYELAMMAWYIIDLKELTLDVNKVLQLALLHDFVEVYAGDTFVYDKDQKALDSKEEREREALEKLEKEWPEQSSFWAIVKEYERKESPETIFVYVLDKLLPFLHVTMNEGVEWREGDISLDLIKKTKEAQMSLSKDIEPYYRQFIILLEENQEKYFGN